MKYFVILAAASLFLYGVGIAVSYFMINLGWLDGLFKAHIFILTGIGLLWSPANAPRVCSEEDALAQCPNCRCDDIACVDRQETPTAEPQPAGQ